MQKCETPARVKCQGFGMEKSWPALSYPDYGPTLVDIQRLAATWLASRVPGLPLSTARAVAEANGLGVIR